MTDGVDQDEVYPLYRDETIIGRDQDCDIILPYVAVSRRHLTIFRDGKSYYAKDIFTRGTILINNKPILQGTGPYLLHDGDRIKICCFVLIFEMKNLDGEPRAY